MYRSGSTVMVVLLAACGRDPSSPGPALPRSDTVEARALWVSRFEYGTASDIVQVLADAQSAKFNIVYFQVRGAADALYASDLEPCSIRLCGRLGGSPTWDPLALAVAEAHARGIQLHAWINSFIGWSATSSGVCDDLTASDAGRPSHALLEHPEWKVVNASGSAHPCPNPEGSVWLSPGIAQVRTRLARVAADITRRYPVDGIHLDFIRYPGLAWSHDTASLRVFGLNPATNATAWAQFRRDQVTAAVREAHDSLAAARPDAVLSAAVWGIFRDKWGWNSSEGYGQYFQDPRAWSSAGTLDVAVPMAYWRIRAAYCEYTDWACLLDDHLAGFAGTGRHMYIGMIATLGVDEMVRQIALGRERGVQGFSVFSYGSAKSTGLFAVLAAGAFRLPARVPTQPWK